MVIVLLAKNPAPPAACAIAGRSEHNAMPANNLL
jgi:hypothetical protein